MRKLASIQLISDIRPIEGADKIEVAQILGWTVVVKKGEFKVGDKVVYCEIDSILPDKPEFAFLKDRGFRIKSVRLRKQLSQGICFPLSILRDYEQTISDGFCDSLREVVEYNIDDDVTDLLGIKKWEPYMPAQLAGMAKSTFPTHLVHKTDVERCQGHPYIIDEFKNAGECYTAMKMDGTSCTIYKHNEDFGVCSRNLELKEDENNIYWKMANKHDLRNKLNTLNRNIAIQGEICGQGIQGNRMHYEDNKFLVFDVYDIDNQKYLDFNDMISVCMQLGLQTVPMLFIGKFMFDSIDDMLKYADNLLYAPGLPAEGIVVRPTKTTYSDRLRGRLSIKAISNTFLLKYSE